MKGCLIMGSTTQWSRRSEGAAKALAQTNRAGGIMPYSLRFFEQLMEVLEHRESNSTEFSANAAATVAGVLTSKVPTFWAAAI